MSKELSKPTKRPMRRSDYELIYSLLEHGTDKVAICKVYGISPKTLANRLALDRPDLAKKTASLPTSVKVDITDASAVQKSLELTGRQTRVHAALLVHHDLRVLAGKAEKQQAQAAADPNFEETTIALKDARNVKALVQVAAMVPGMGFEAASGGGGVHVHTTLNHATVMRMEKGGLLADEIPADAIVVSPPPDALE